MKKLIYGSLFLALVGIGFSGCKKEYENQILHEIDSDVTSDGKLLIFKNVESYEKTLEFRSEKNRTEFLTYISSLNYKNYFSANHSQAKSVNDTVQEMDEFFGLLLNQDGAIQIGNFIYKVNLNSQKVFVLPSSSYSEYDDLVNENVSNKNIRVFTTNEDVIHLVETGAGSTKCNNPSGGFEWYTVAQSGTAFETRCYLKYFTAGIYYRVTGRTKKIGNFGGNYRFYLECVNSNTQIRRNPCSNGDITLHEIGVKMNTMNNPEPVFEMYSKAWKIKGYTHIQIRSRAEFYAENTLYVQTTPVTYTLN